MKVLQVTTTEFRNKQKSLLDMADKGQRIIIKRNRKPSYTLVPIEDEDLDSSFTPEILAKIEKARAQIRNGKYVQISTKEELDKYFENL